MADTLKFGPEWLRALSDGNNVGTPPPSPGFGKYKLADYRYGREEMLALFNPDADPPEDLKDIPTIFIEKKQEPLALVPLSEEEQRILSQSVNSVAVLRMSGRGGPPGVRGSRGGGPTRGRGRGRGEFMQRGMSYDETGGGFGRPPSHTRNDGWEEVGAKRSFNRYDDGSTGPPKREFNRSLSSENWRERGGNEDEDDDGDWRKAGGSKWNSRASWRDPVGRGGGFDRQNGLQRGGFDKTRSYQRNRTSESWDDDENLPEWSMPDSEDVEELGTFDSSGAFVSTKQKEEKRGENRDNQHKSDSPPTVENKTKSKQSEDPKTYKEKSETVKVKEKETDTRPKSAIENGQAAPQRVKTESPKPKESDQGSGAKNSSSSTASNKQSEKTQQKKAEKSRKEVTSDPAVSQSEAKPSKEKAAKQKNNSQSSQSVVDSNLKSSAPKLDTSGAKKLTKNLSETENEALEKLQDTAENMVLAAMTAEEEEKFTKPTSNSPVMPPESENSQKWFYKDPQGDVQGPFLSSEMAEWFSAGYFTMNLLIRRGCDEKFSQLGELIKRWGRVPFLAGPPQQPLLNTPPNQPNPEAIQQQQQQQEHLKALQAQILLQQQVMQQQLMMRQFQMQQVMQQFQEHEQFKSLPVAQQQQLVMQILAKQQQQQSPMMIPQSQPQKLSPRSPPTEAAASGDHTPPSSNHPSFHRSLSQPSDSHTEEGSIWGGVHALRTGSQPTSVWDLPVDPKSVITASELEAQIEKVRKEKEESERLRKLQEEEERRKLHEEYVRKQEELMKQTAEIQRQKEEMERQKQELEQKRRIELQKLEEARKEEEAAARRQAAEEEEKRKQEQLLRQREEEMRRKQEEEMRQRREEELRQQRELKRKEELRQYELQQEELLQQERMRQELQKKREQEELEKKKEIQRRQELQNQQELQRQQQEALRKLQQDQLSKIQLPSHAQWGSQPVANTPQKMKSLLEIQEQEEKERREKEERERQMEAERQQMLALQQQQQQQKTWSSQMFPGTTPGMKSLLEIQEEQSRQQEKDKQRKQQQNQTQAKQNLTLGAASAWGGSVTSPSHWASEGAWGHAVRQAESLNSSASNGAGSLGFWDTAIISSKKATPKQSNQGPPADFPSLKGQSQKAPSSTQQSNKARPSKSKKEEDAVQRLFQTSIPVDEFTQWCEKALNNMNSSVDIPTFVSFLKEIESPYEVHDYVRTYLGETKGAQDFAKQFLEKRSHFRNKAKQQQQQVEDSIWGPAPARDFRQSNNQSSESDSQRSKGKKKKKMMKIDSSILGFTCAADPDRINVGEIDGDGTPK